MKFLSIFKHQGVTVVAAFALLLAVVVPAIASAAQLTERSIALSNSSAAATDVTYKVNFKAVSAAGAFVVNFCSNTPVIGQPCTAPVGFDLVTPASVTSGFTTVSALTDNTLLVEGPITAGQNVSVDVSGIKNPTTAGPLYARIVTYTTPELAGDYLPGQTEAQRVGSVDDGGAAISITNSIGVAGAVLETMTFCISGAVIAKDCVGAGASAPVIQLGETVGDAIALIPTAISTGSIYTQISTNAVNGATISLKSSAASCGGLVRAGAPSSCDIKPTIADDLVAGEARFGVKTTDSTDSAGVDPADAVGALVPASGSSYNKATFAFNYVGGNATGVTSTFGDAFLDTANAPANNKNMQLIFGASIANDTPAGLYSTNLSLIATGKF